MFSSTEPLGRPRGSVRALLTLMLVCACVCTLFVPIVDDRAMEMLMMLTAIAVKSYYDTRQVQNDQDGPVLPPPAVNGE